MDCTMGGCGKKTDCAHCRFNAEVAQERLKEPWKQTESGLRYKQSLREKTNELPGL